MVYRSPEDKEYELAKRRLTSRHALGVAVVRLRALRPEEFRSVLDEVRKANPGLSASKSYKRAEHIFREKYASEFRRIHQEEAAKAGLRPRTKDDAKYREIYGIETRAGVWDLKKER